MFTQSQYLQRKIDSKRLYDSDTFYLNLGRTMTEEWALHSEFPFAGADSSGIRDEVALNLVCYLMDVVADMGLWRAFTSTCRSLYGSPVPFYSDEEYIDFELNRADVRFMTWYTLNFTLKLSSPPLNPFDEDLIKLYDFLYQVMERLYDEAPVPEGMIKTNELEMHDPEDADAIQTLGHWIFWSSYLCIPAFKSNMELIASQTDMDDRRAVLQTMGQAQMELPTGPLALFLREWVWLIVEGKMPPQPRSAKENVDESQKKEHPYYRPFMKATDGSSMAFFDDYKTLNKFLAAAFGWDSEADNLPQLKGSKDFTLLINPKKGLLIGRDVARCICHPKNPYYDAQYAAKQDISLITVRGRCPIDLTLYSIKHNLLPDLKWTTNPTALIAGNDADVIARSFLQQYYRAD